jgi:hypothetical protein
MVAARQFSPHYDDVLREVAARIDASGSVGKGDIAHLPSGNGYVGPLD